MEQIQHLKLRKKVSGKAQKTEGHSEGEGSHYTSTFVSL